LFEKYGVHPNQDMENGIYCSTGSLGQGLPIAVGAALSNLQQNVYCLISDGEAAEGSMYEAINVINKYNIENIKIYVNFNGWGAYDHIAKLNLPECKAVKIIYTSMEFPFLKGQDAHYHVMTEDEYKLGLSLI
jgi:transketolase